MLEKQEIYCLLIAIAWISSIEFTSVIATTPHGSDSPEKPKSVKNTVHVSSAPQTHVVRPFKATLQVENPQKPGEFKYYELDFCMETDKTEIINDKGEKEEDYVHKYKCTGKSNYYAQQYIGFIFCFYKTFQAVDSPHFMEN